MTHPAALLADLALFAQRQPQPAPPAAQAGANAVAIVAMICPLVIVLALGAVIIASRWKLFSKAGQPGWAAIVPVYGTYILTCEVAKKEILWFVLALVPCVQFVALFVILMEVARKFGKSDGFGVGMVLLPFVFFPMLAFGDARYQGGRTRPADRYDDELEDEDDRSRRRPRRDDD